MTSLDLIQTSIVCINPCKFILPLEYFAFELLFFIFVANWVGFLHDYNRIGSEKLSSAYKRIIIEEMDGEHIEEY